MNQNIWSKSITNQETQIRKLLKLHRDDLNKYHTTLQLNSFDLSSEHMQIFANNTIAMTFLDKGQETIKNFDINSATQQISSFATQMISEPLSNFTGTNPSVYFLFYNLGNDYYDSLKRSMDFYVLQLLSLSNTNKNNSLILVIVTGILLFFVICAILPTYAMALSFEIEICKLFLNIPVNKVKFYGTKCEQFINLLQVPLFLAF